MSKSKNSIEKVKEIYKRNGKQAERLREKCQWEKMSPVAVLESWPDLLDGIKD